MTDSTIDIGDFTEPLLVFGGPYSNLAATEAMQAEAQRLEIPPERVICTGDLVAYCASPQATVDLIRAWGIHVVRGNCEESLASGALDCGCGFAVGTVCSTLSGQWYNYALQHIDAPTRDWFGTLPAALRLRFCGRPLQVVHGTPSQINRFVFASTPPQEKTGQLALNDGTGLIAGHCGIPFGETLASQVWLNAGVIGLPANDGTPDGWYLLLGGDGERCHASWHRLAYPAEVTAQQMQTAGLQCGYAETIISGLWPSEDVLPAAEKQQRGVALQPATVYF